MRPIDYQPSPPEPRRWFARAEFIIVLSAVAFLMAILVAAGYYYFITLKVGF